MSVFCCCVHIVALLYGGLCGRACMYGRCVCGV